MDQYSMNFDFLTLLVYAVALTGFIAIIDEIFWARNRRKRGDEPGILIEYARSFFPILLIVLLVRSFLVQPFRVPTGSLEPTVLPGDFIAVNQYAYGLRWPVVNRKFIEVGHPKTGDIAVFRWPVNEKVTFVKRVIGVPGDHVQYVNKTLFINGVEAKQEVVGPAIDEENDYAVKVEERTEKLNGVKHSIFVRDEISSEDFDIYVPSDHYFMMGDNRDNSEDSREWGFVKDEQFIGKAFGIWLSWDKHKKRFRWHRIGTSLLHADNHAGQQHKDKSSS